MRVGFLGTSILLALVLPVAAELYDADDNDDEDYDMDMLLDVLRRTRGKPAPTSAMPRSSQAARSTSATSALSRLIDSLGDTGEAETLSALMRGVAGQAGKHQQRAESSDVGKSRAKGAKYRKDSVDLDSLRTREKYQKTQADRVRQCYKEGKAQILLLGSRDQVTTANVTWAVPCATKFYQDAYGIIPGCTPSIARGGLCSRVVMDGFGTQEDMRDLQLATEDAMINLFHQGGTTSLAPASSLDRLGSKGAILFQFYLAKIKLQIMKDFHLTSLYDSGALLTRLQGEPPEDEWDMEPGHIYWNPHVDKANIPTYDYSALLYLNNKGADFEGGDFAFLDDDADRIIEPRAGRLLYFTSGPENLCAYLFVGLFVSHVLHPADAIRLSPYSTILNIAQALSDPLLTVITETPPNARHQVREVRKGTRYVLAMWFTCSKADRYRDDE